jgi:glycosyltransferase involved in cell wall biosynthesis
VLRSADAVIANTEGNKAAIHEAFPFMPDEKVIVVNNGFDTERAEGKSDTAASAADCDLVYTGTLYRGMLDVYVEALRYFKRMGKPLPKLRVYGPRPFHLRLDDDVAESVEWCGQTTYEESLVLMRRAKALLALVPHGSRFNTWVPSKFYPYMFSSTPILALVPEGDAARILERSGTAVVVRSGDPAEVAARIESFLKAVSAGNQPGQSTTRDLNRYSWSELSTRIDKVLRNER